ncbi:hypothetical protein D3C72_1893810 [compost metagenome]
MIHITRLQPAHQCSDTADHLPGAIDDQTVDETLIAHLPEHGTEDTCATGKDILIHPVHAVFAFQHLVQADLLRSALDGCRNLGLDHVEDEGHYDTCQCQPERCSSKAVQCHRHPTVNLLGQFRHGTVLGAIDIDHTLEEVAKQHGHQRDGTNHH